MKALIIASGKIKDYDLLNSLVQKNDFILCADGGINHLMKIGLIPNLVLGDLDSISENGIDYIRENNIIIEKHPVMKDETDTHLAVNYAILKGYTEITIIGGIGSRIDHSLANIYLLRTINKNGIKGRIINENNIIHLVDKKLILSKKENYFASIIPISLSGIRISITGFLYPLNDQQIEFGSTRGISNQVTDDYGIIKIYNGEALVIESKDM